MAFCRYCGMELKEGVLFCGRCGTKVGENEPPQNMQSQDTTRQNVYGRMPDHSGKADPTDEIKKKLDAGKDKAVEKSKEAADKFQEWLPEAKEQAGTFWNGQVEKCRNDKKYAMTLAGAGAAIVLAIVLCVVFSGMSKKIDLQDCLAVNFYGYEGNGNADVVLNEEKFQKKLLRAKGKKILQDGSYYELRECVNFEVNSGSGLSNGDQLTIEMKCDNETAKEHKIKFADKTYTYKVKGLGKLKEIDPFQGLKVSFEGISPDMTVRCQYEGDEEYFQGAVFEAEPSKGIAIGDQVKISIQHSEEEAEAYGFKIKQTSKEYTCKKGDSYLAGMKALEDSVLKELKDSGSDIISSFYAEQYEYIACDDLNYAGSYLLTPKKNSGVTGNLLYMIYKGTVVSKESAFNPTVVYMPVCFKDVLIKADGSAEYDSYNRKILGDTGLPYDGWSSVPGYLDQNSMFHELAGRAVVDYTYEISGELEENAETMNDPQTVAGSGDYVLPGSDSRYIPQEEIRALTKEELRIARNEIYARHGRIFKDEGLQAYFNSKPWYSRKKAEVAESELNKFEIANRDAIIQAEK